MYTPHKNEGIEKNLNNFLRLLVSLSLFHLTKLHTSIRIIISTPAAGKRCVYYNRKKYNTDLTETLTDFFLSFFPLLDFSLSIPFYILFIHSTD